MSFGLLSFVGTVLEFRAYLAEWRRLERRDRFIRLMTKPGKRGSSYGSKKYIQAAG